MATVFGVPLAKTATVFDIQYLMGARIAVGRFIQVKEEIMRIVEVDDARTVTVARGQAGSAAVSAVAGTAVNVPRQTSLIAPISLSNATSFLVDSLVAGDIKAGVYIQVENEIMYVSSTAGSQNLTVLRAQMSTVATTHEQSAAVFVVRRTKTAGGILQTTNTSFTLVTTSILAVGDLLQLDDEIMKVRTVVGQVVGVDRGQAATSVSTHADGVTVTVLPIGILNPASASSGSTNSTAIQINVTSTAAMGLTKVGQFIRVGNEVMLVTGFGAVDSGGSLLNVARGAGGTNADMHASSARVELAATATLNVALSTTDTTVSISSVNEFSGKLQVNSKLQIGSEIMTVTELAAGGIIVERGQSATTATTHASDDHIFLIQSTLLAFGDQLVPEETVINMESAVGIENVGGLAENGYIRIENEVMRIVAGANTDVSNSITVERAQLGTAAQPHQDGTPVTVPKTTYVRDDMITSIQDFVVLASPARIELTVGSYLAIGSEVVRVTEIRGLNISITRRQLATSVANHRAGTLAIKWQSCKLTMGIRGLSPGYLSFNDTMMRVDSPTICGISSNTYVQIDKEILFVTSAHATLTRAFMVNRGISSTLAATHADDSSVVPLRMTVVRQPGGLGASDTLVTLDSAAAIGITGPHGYIKIDQEVMRVVSVTEQNLTVVRAQAGSPAAEHANDAAVTLIDSTTLSSPVSASDTLFQAVDATAVPLAVGKYYQIDDEIVLVTHLVGNNATVTRGEVSTTAVSHTTNASIIAVHRTKILMGRVVSTTATQILVHSLKDAQIVPGSNILVGSEIMLVTAVSTALNTATVLRAQAGTTAATHADGSLVSSVLPLFNIAGQAAATSLFGLGATWEQIPGRLTLSVLPMAIVANDTQYAVSFQLKNPDVSQAARSPSISAIGSVGIAESAMDVDDALVLPYAGAAAGDAAPLKVEAAVFKLKSLAQSTPYPSANNTITCTLGVNVLLTMAAKITIFGLIGSTTPSTSSMQLQGAAKHVFGNFSQWQQGSGSLILTVATSQSMRPKTGYVISFTLKNPATAQTSNHVSIAARGHPVPVGNPLQFAPSRMIVDAECIPHTGTTVLRAAVENRLATSISVLNITEIGISAGRLLQIDNEIMLVVVVAADNQLIVRRGQQGTTATCHSKDTRVYHMLMGTTKGDCVPLRTYSPAFVLRSAGQNSFFMNANNDITVTLATNVDLTQMAASAVTLTGLVETLTNDTAHMSISYGTGVSSVFGSTGVWTSKLWHPDPMERIGRLVLTVASGLTLYANTPYTFSFTVKNFALTQTVVADVGQVAATVRVAARGSARIPYSLVASDPTRYPCASTTTLQAGVTASATTITVVSVNSMTAGRLVVVGDEVMDIVSVSGTTFTVRRASAGSEAVGHLQGAPVCMVQMGGRPGLASPLALWKDGVIMVKIGQSTPLPEATNTITVTFVTNVNIDNAAWSNIIKLSITGLTGTQTADDSSLAITDIQNSGTATYFESTADWSRTTGTLVLSQKIYTQINAFTTLVFSFSVTNPSTPQMPPTLSWSIVSTELMHSGNLEPDLDSVPAVACAEAGDSAPLSVRTSGVCIKEIAQSTPFPGALNTLTVSLAPTGYLRGSENSKITITGLTGSQTDDATLTITDVGSTSANVLLGNNAVWTKTSGKLVISVANGQTLGAGQLVSFSFQIINPAPKSSPLPILVSTSGSRVLGPERMVLQDKRAPFTASTTLSNDVHACVSSSVQLASSAGVDAGTILQIDDELVRVSAVAGTDVTVTRGFDGTSPALHKTGTTVYLVKPGCSIGDAAPLRVHARSLFSAKIGQSTSSPSQINTLTVTFAVNAQLDTPVFSKVIITGLTGSSTGGGSTLVSLDIRDRGAPSATTIFGSSGSWNQTAGSLTLTVAAGQNLAAATDVIFSFDLVNPVSGQAPRSTSIVAECLHSDASLHYTTDGSQPTSGSSTYTSAVAVTTGQTLKAVASYDDQRDSDLASATYT